MSERDYSNDPDDYWRQYPGAQHDGGVTAPSGDPWATEQPLAPPPPPRATNTAPNTTPPPTTGGRPPKPTEAPEGYEWVDAYDGGWQLRRLGGGNYYTNGGLGGGGDTAPNPFGGTGTISAMMPNEGFQWPTYNPRSFSFGEFGGFKPFNAPTMEEILADPVLQAQLTEGQKRIKQDRAFQGVLNTGGTLKDLFDWQGDRIKLGANDAFDRKFKVYDVNERQNPFNTWSANKGLAIDSFDRNASQQKDAFLYNQFEPAQARWKQNFDTWAKQGDWTTNVATAFPD